MVLGTMSCAEIKNIVVVFIPSLVIAVVNDNQRFIGHPYLMQMDCGNIAVVEILIK